MNRPGRTSSKCERMQLAGPWSGGAPGRRAAPGNLGAYSGWPISAAASKPPLDQAQGPALLARKAAKSFAGAGGYEPNNHCFWLRADFRPPSLRCLRWPCGASSDLAGVKPKTQPLARLEHASGYSCWSGPISLTRSPPCGSG